MTQTPPRMIALPRHRRLVLITASTAIAAACLVLAPRATAGTYRAVQCHEPLGAGHADATFARNSRRYLPGTDCDGEGLGITHAAGSGRTAHRRFGAWTLTAPSGTAIVRADARVRAAGTDGHVAEAFMTLADGSRRPLGRLRRERSPVGWTGTGGQALTARLECSRPAGCGSGRSAWVHLRRVTLALRDAAAPTVSPSGSLLAPGSRRASQHLRVDAGDSGGGVRTVSLEVNGDPLASQVFGCRLAGAVALRLRPCPPSAAAHFDLATTGRLFRQGPNRLRVCAADYAPRGNANRICAVRTVRVDNACPVSESDAVSLRARLAGRRTAVTGGLTSASGGPVADVRVCIAARVRATGAAERVIATPLTDAAGRFRARIPAGPSREVRVAHWPDEDRALERHLTVNARAIPHLRLRPDREIRNGSRARFRVELPGPANGGREVAIHARSGSRWIRIAGGRTSPAGVWHGHYRFRATTGTRRYAFRAAVRHQPGYPYRSGRSRIARITVVGH